MSPEEYGAWALADEQRSVSREAVAAAIQKTLLSRIEGGGGPDAGEYLRLILQDVGMA